MSNITKQSKNNICPPASLSTGDVWDRCFSFAGLAGRGGGQAAHADWTGPTAERAVWSPEHISSKQLRTGPGEVQYLYRADLFGMTLNLISWAS